MKTAKTEIKYSMAVLAIQKKVSEQLEYRKWLRKEIKKDMPYKCYTKTKAERRRKDFKRDVIRITSELKQLNAAWRFLVRNNH